MGIELALRLLIAREAKNLIFKEHLSEAERRALYLRYVSGMTRARALNIVPPEPQGEISPLKSMRRYAPMIRMLDEADLTGIDLSIFELYRKRRQRRVIFRGWVKDLRNEAISLLEERALYGSCDMATLYRDRAQVDVHIRELRIYLWCHRFKPIPGLPAKIARTLTQIGAVLGFGPSLCASEPSLA